MNSRAAASPYQHASGEPQQLAATARLVSVYAATPLTLADTSGLTLSP